MQEVIVGQIKGALVLGEEKYNLDQPVTKKEMTMALHKIEAAEQVEDLIGSGDAKVSLSFGMSEKDFGNGST